jgi:hypothetical protein
MGISIYFYTPTVTSSRGERNSVREVQDHLESAWQIRWQIYPWRYWPVRASKLRYTQSLHLPCRTWRAYRISSLIN